MKECDEYGGVAFTYIDHMNTSMLSLIFRPKCKYL